MRKSVGFLFYMPKPRKNKRKKRSAKIKLSERFKLVHKNDATRVDDEKVRAARGRRAPVQLVDDNGANFKIKIRRKK